jgi:hypothetical protein
MYYFEVFKALHDKKVEYLVVGGLAVNLYGVPRLTHDIDIVISMRKKNVMDIISLLTDLGYVPRLPVKSADLADPEKVKDWTENRNMKAFSFHHRKDAYKVIDIVLVHPLDFEESFRNRTVKKVKDITINLASIDDLIRTKEASGRAQDISDIEMLKKAKAFLEGDT